MMSVQQIDDHMSRYLITDDKDKQAITVSLRTDPTKSSSMAYAMPEPGVLTLDGSFQGETIKARLRKRENPEFFLTTRGFNWVQEFPLNR